MPRGGRAERTTRTARRAAPRHPLALMAFGHVRETTTAGEPRRTGFAGRRPPMGDYSASTPAIESMSVGMPPSHLKLSAVGGETDDTVTGS